MKRDNSEDRKRYIRSAPSILDRIAGVLGCDVHDFYDAAASCEKYDITEVIELWRSLETDDDRHRVIRLMRERSGHNR